MRLVDSFDSRGKGTRPLCRDVWSAAAAVVAVSLVGCGGAEATVSGVVSLDGTPLSTGTVSFVPVVGTKGAGASGMIGDGGDYSIQVARTGGLPAGEYKVKVVSLAPSILDPKGGPPTPGRLLVPKKYTSTTTSGLRYEVEPGRNTFDIELKSDGR